MYYVPDIIALGPDGQDVRVVVEVEGSHALEDKGLDLVRAYMHGMNVRVGVVVSPVRVVILRNRFDALGDQAVEVAADVATNDDRWLRSYVAGVSADRRQAASILEGGVHRWLDDLAAGRGLDELPVGLRESVETLVVPTILGSEVRAGRPRERVALGA